MPQTTADPAPPSIATLARTSLAALAVAAALLVTVVLPAEYGIDPLGTGRRLGLTAFANPPLTSIESPPAAGAPQAPVQAGPVGEYPADYKVDVVDITLPPYEFVEYKYHLEKGATMLYSWTATAPVVQELHGERSREPLDGPREESFDRRDRREGRGTFTAPFTGIHGWYWENPGAETIVVRLNSAGFYTSAVEIHSDRSRSPRTLTEIDGQPPAQGGGKGGRE